MSAPETGEADGNRRFETERNMSMDAEADLAELRARMRAQHEYAGKHGESWVEHYKDEFARLVKGTIVVINCRTGQYVLGPTRNEAADEFERRFGKEIGYMIEIGGGIFVGGGIG
jgi:hypothetical protein